jgi:hypothetical protein
MLRYFQRKLASLFLPCRFFGERSFFRLVALFPISGLDFGFGSLLYILP